MSWICRKDLHRLERVIEPTRPVALQDFEDFETGSPESSTVAPAPQRCASLHHSL